ncbi:uncharacterized protein LOC113212275 [Frankliniella occidentalis]|uniref:Uncharacterized protein LOC113212275 n=1 Tax=Frankliniella occidentalis TaxID=133901 RepID=A0A9C6XTR8_FRAOC|nr:uncharacterized protein LOC113212275 [Frankliniella occidentalis]
MERLSDDVVLLVLQYVGVDDLFTCRLVCKRLGGLALHPGVWRYRRSHSWRPERRENVCRLLRLAPRLAWLSFDFPPKQDVHSALYATTRCAVRELMTHVYVDGGVHAALFLRNQEALGQLRVVTLWLTDRRGPIDAVLLGTVASSSILEKLTVRSGWDHWDSGLAAAIRHTTIAQPSLKYLNCRLNSNSQPFVDLVLAGHAATLEVVSLGETTTSTGSLPECMPNLRVLTCSLLPGMETLAPSLTKVTLHVTPDMRPGVLGATEMLRRAPKLRVLTLKYRPAARTSAHVGVDLVEALAWSGRSAVEVLEIDNDWFTELVGVDSDDVGIEFLPQLQPLVRTLPSLP